MLGAEQRGQLGPAGVGCSLSVLTLLSTAPFSSPAQVGADAVSHGATGKGNDQVC